MATEFQTTLYHFILDYVSAHSTSPTYSEMISAMGISPRSKSLINRSLQALKKEGKIFLKKEGRRLQISISQKRLPLVGRISAGHPIEAIQEYRFIDVNQLLMGEGRFALQVKGNSMIEDGILDGDIIVCRQSHIANEGDIVVALIDQHNTTLKRISYKTSGSITLIPGNVDLQPKRYHPEQIAIQGIYMGLLRLNEG